MAAIKSSKFAEKRCKEHSDESPRKGREQKHPQVSVKAEELQEKLLKKERKVKTPEPSGRDVTRGRAADRM